MAVCGNCGAIGPRVRSRWQEGQQLPDECPQCAPQTFEKQTNPSDKKIWMGYEAHPNEYVKAEDGGFDRKPEYRAEQENQLRQPAADDVEQQRVADERKRASRRTMPMDTQETLQALAKARLIAGALEQAAVEAEKSAREAELQAWVEKASQA